MMKKIVNIELSNDPHIHTRSVLFIDNEEEIESKNKKQFITCTPAYLTVTFEDGTKLNLFAPKGTIFDGATIPFGIGKGNMQLQIPALFHDIICVNKSLVGYDRSLASKIFYRSLLKCKVNKFIAWIMYINVEIYQMSPLCNWRKPNE